MNFYVAPIVEGQTEVDSVKRLLQRVWTELLAVPTPLRILQRSRCKRDVIINPTRPDLANKVEEAFADLRQYLRKDPTGCGLVLLLLDAEGDCPAELGPRLLRDAKKARSDATICCVLAKRMLENWIVAGASTLGGVNGLPDSLQPPDKPEDCSGAAWLDKQIRSRNRTRKYGKTTDAQAFVKKMDLVGCRATSPSFDKLCRELEKLLHLQDAQNFTGDSAE